MIIYFRPNLTAMRIYGIIIFWISWIVSSWGQHALTLNEAIKNAVENNYQIRIASNELAIDAANNTKGNAGMLPEVALNFGQTFNINNSRLELSNGDVRQGSGANSRNLSANIQAAWTVFDGMRMFVTRDRLGEIENLGKINLQMQIENTVAQVMELYYGLEYQQERLKTIKEAIEISKERLQLAKLKQDAGSGSGIPIIQAQVDINADSSMLINQELLYKNMKINLNSLMAKNPEFDFVIFETESLPIPNLDEVLNLASQRNKMLQLANKNLAISGLTIKQWEANKYPTLDVNAGYNFSQANAEIGVFKFNQNAGVSFGLTGRWNIFNGWNNKREIQVAKLNLESGKLAKEETELNVKANIHTVHNTFVNANKMVGQEDKNIMAAKQNLVITSEKMRVGSINSLELRQAQLNLIEAQFRKLTAIYEGKLANLELIRLSGGLFSN